MSIFLRLPETTEVYTLERALALLGFRLSQTVERTDDGEPIYCAEDPLGRPGRPDPTCRVCGDPAPTLVGHAYYCFAHWRDAYQDAERSAGEIAK